ncbi:oligosaccharide flippase family protein [Arcobacter arenosus]|uniref:Polysaccharide biosynthesis protein n=1 Tax=Arcobacter arenosus TaxID=2576037 RepID=A0A5R8XY64_9BACT|nr:oligosaccharide flippase family protein [Arcobacter arenosus]TLP36816.1 hypothetical protein FDK22_11235 [Arcobacter arenosus]
MNNDILKNMLILATGTASSKLITFLAIPFITRLYTPEEFGILTIFISLLAILLPFGTLKYTTAIPLPKKENTAVNLTFLILFIILIVTLSVFLIFLFFKNEIFYLFKIEKIIDFWWLIPIALLLYSLYETFNFWFTRKKQFKLLSKNMFFQTTVGTIIKLIAGYLSFGAIGLIIGQIVSQSIGFFILIVNFIKTVKITINIRYILFLLKYYVDFPKFKLPSHFLYILSFQAPLIFTSILYGTEATGQLGLAFSVLALPITLIGQTTSQAYYSEIARIGKKQPKKILSITKNLTKKLAVISILPFIVLILFAPYLFEIVFGKNWSEAGEFARILSIFLLGQFISSPLMQVFNVINKQKDVLFIHLRRLIYVLIIFAYGNYYEISILHLLIIYSVILTIHYFQVYYQIIRILKQNQIINSLQKEEK